MKEELILDWSFPVENDTQLQQRLHSFDSSPLLKWFQTYLRTYLKYESVAKIETQLSSLRWLRYCALFPISICCSIFTHFPSIAYLSLNEMHTKGTNQINFWKQFLDRSYLMAIGKEEIKVVSNLGLVSVWPDLAKFRHFGKLLTAYFLFGKKLNLLWQIYYITGQIFVAANGLILKHNLIIWSHW